MHNKFLKSIFTLLLFSASGASAQFSIDTVATAQRMADTLASSGVTISNVTFTGSQGARGIFHDLSATLGISDGIILSSGSLNNFNAPSSNLLNGNMQTAGHPNLTNLAGATSYDAAVLEFDLVAISDSIYLRFAFASEEYSDFVNAAYNDVMAVFISGPGISGTKNMALVPASNLPVKINNINNGQAPVGTPPSGPCVNCSYYLDNTGSSSFAYDGYTTVIAAKKNVQPCGTYHIKIAIGDVGDRFYDSAIFLEAKSLHSSDSLNITAVGYPGQNYINICPDNGIVLTAPESDNYLWNTGSTTQSIFVNSANIVAGGNYSVTISNTAQTCFVYSNPIHVEVDSSFSNLVVSNDTMICGGGSVQLSINGCNGCTYTWKEDTVIVSSQSNPVFTPAVTTQYDYTASSPSGCVYTNSILVTVSSNCPFVWPGDADNDLAANNYDILPLGYYYGMNVTARSSVSNSWTAQDALNSGIMQYNSADLKHADCNGDGTINENDTAAIKQNFNLVHPARLSSGNKLSSVNPDLYFTTASSAYGPGDWIDAEVWIGTSANSVTDFYGIAYDISYDNSLIQAGTRTFNNTSGWLGNPGVNAITFNRLANGMVNGAFCRKDFTGINGYGKIGILHFRVNVLITTPQYLVLNFNNYQAIDANGNYVTLNAMSDTIYIDPLLGVNELSSDNNFKIYPNPNKGEFSVKTDFKPGTNSLLKIKNMFGEEVYKQNLEKPEQIISLSRIDIPAGVYYIEIKNAEKIMTARLILEK
ncbi:MAG TPA: choice-of-anchor L domain-containing protein [Bacteroidia bacterium]|nr:choice-of-anchor L domain-containing protein [Bacteroidia bacterium]